MRILIEEHQYAVSDIRDVIQGIDALENVEGYVSIHYVGYYYNTLLNDCVLIALKGQLPERHVVKTAPKGTQEKLGEGILNTGNTGRITDFVLVAERPCLMMKKQSA